MSAFINTVDILGDDALTEQIIARNITEYRDDAIKNIAYNAFRMCTALTIVDLCSVTSIEGFVFYGCSALTTLIIRTVSLCVAASVPCGNTPIASGNGYVYVPKTLLEEYKSATNWSNYASQFRALEDYTVDGTIMGELDPNKI